MSLKDLTELDGKGLLERAQSSVEEGKLEDALGVFNEIIRRTDSKLPSPVFSRATCYIQLKKYKEAIADCKLILSLPDEPIDGGLVPGSTSLHSAAYSRLNNAYKNLNMIEEASEALKLRSDLEQKLQKETKSKAVDSKKDVSKRKTETASEIIEKSEIPPELQSKINALKEKGNMLYQESKFAEAIKIYELALKHYSDNAAVHSNLSQTYLKLEKYTEALFHANETVRIKSNWAKGYYRQGQIYMKLEKFQEATQSLQLALQHAPEDQLIASLLVQALSSNNSITYFKRQHLNTFISCLLAVICAAYITGAFDYIWPVIAKTGKF